MTQSNPSAATAKAWSGFVGMGLTAGGDKLASIQYTNGDTHNIKAGEQIDFRVGLNWRVPAAAFGVQASIGYFFDKANGSNGSTEFSRVPLELVGQWYAQENFKLGLGLRSTSGAKFKSSGAAAALGNESFKSSTGLLIEGEWLFSGRFGVGLRYVSENYTPASGGRKFSGNHAGVRMNMYF